VLYPEPKNENTKHKVQSSVNHIIALYKKDQYGGNIYTGKGFSATNCNAISSRT
jgi:hypothetical protein